MPVTTHPGPPCGGMNAARPPVQQQPCDADGRPSNVDDVTLWRQLIAGLHDCVVDGSEHLFEMTGPNDSLVERGVVGFVGGPALEEYERPRIAFFPK